MLSISVYLTGQYDRDGGENGEGEDVGLDRMLLSEVPGGMRGTHILMKSSVLLSVISQIREEHGEGADFLSSLQALQVQWINLWKSFNVKYKKSSADSFKSYVAIIKVTEELYRRSMSELIKMLSVLQLGGRRHFTVWNAFITHAIINTLKWCNVDAVSTTASGQAFTLTLEMIAELNDESKSI